jgi:hypothetical protein
MARKTGARGSNPFTPTIIFSGRLGRQGIQGTIQKYVPTTGNSLRVPKNPVIAGKIHKDFFKWTESGQTDMEKSWKI